MARKKNLKQKKELNLIFGYGHELTPKLINDFMVHGKKSVVEKFVLPAIETVKNNLNVSERELIETICRNLSTTQEIANRKHKGTTLSIPVPVSVDRARRQVLKLIVKCTRAHRNEKGISSEEALITILSDAYNKTGTITRKLEEKIEAVRSKNMFSHLSFRKHKTAKKIASDTIIDETKTVIEKTSVEDNKTINKPETSTQANENDSKVEKNVTEISPNIIKG